MSKGLAGGRFYRAKASVVDVLEGGYVGVLRAPDAVVLKVDQADLETVVPAVGGRVRILSGPGAGRDALLEALHLEDFCADLAPLPAGGAGASIAAALRRVDYERFSKLASD